MCRNVTMTYLVLLRMLRPTACCQRCFFFSIKINHLWKAFDAHKHMWWSFVTHFSTTCRLFTGDGFDFLLFLVDRLFLVSLCVCMFMSEWFFFIFGFTYDCLSISIATEGKAINYNSISVFIKCLAINSFYYALGDFCEASISFAFLDFLPIHLA